MSGHVLGHVNHEGGTFGDTLTSLVPPGFAGCVYPRACAPLILHSFGQIYKVFHRPGNPVLMLGIWH